jgi:lysophospholipid acyltransferase (LPLAT)-like uncharacterized protein
MKLADRILLSTVPVVASSVIRLLKLSIRSETIGVEHLTSLWDKQERAIIAFWHDQLLLMVTGYPGKGAKLLISESKDGELLTRTMKFFKHGTIRGSSSRGGRAAFKEMISMAQSDFDIVLTPDGPRGPRHELKDGVLQLARLSGRPVIPMAFACSHGYRFGSWDQCLLPYPFSRGVFSFGKPLYFNKDEGLVSFREQLQDAMQLNQHQTEQRLKSYGLSAV